MSQSARSIHVQDEILCARIPNEDTINFEDYLLENDTMAAVMNEGWDIRFNIKSNEVPLCLQELNLVVVELKLALQAFHSVAFVA